MAIENRGGPRPGPQNNPMNIDVSGGRGQNPKKPELKYRGLGYGTTGETNAQATAAPIKAQPMGGVARGEYSGAPVTPLTAPTANPDESIFSGSTIPGGLDFSELNLPKQPTGDPDLDTVREYYPLMRFWASQPDTPAATKEYVRFLGTIV